MNRPEEWRIEADDEWLAAHSSDSFARLRHRFRGIGGMGEAVSNAELGPFGGAPRKPETRIHRKTYAVVRYAERRVAYTTIHVDVRPCPRCRRRLALVLQRIVFVRERGGRLMVGTVRMCRYCQADSWMFRSHMPSAARARRRGYKVVL
ncbi:hypothetical protein GCM10023322_53290 [Rugosimonospora acidiphila]|uniref:Uncharacterized protein n=1 Tax=Rugosimonospora acidiphila TaxID=556531 RepID=A0ABP9S8R6_9ACTN